MFPTLPAKLAQLTDSSAVRIIRRLIKLIEDLCEVPSDAWTPEEQICVRDHSSLSYRTILFHPDGSISLYRHFISFEFDFNPQGINSLALEINPRLGRFTLKSILGLESHIYAQLTAPFQALLLHFPHLNSLHTSFPLPADMTLFSALTSIYIVQANSVLSLPPSLASLPNLVKIHLDRCLNLQNIPSSLSDLPWLLFEVEFCPKLAIEANWPPEVWLNCDIVINDNQLYTDFKRGSYDNDGMYYSFPKPADMRYIVEHTYFGYNFDFSYRNEIKKSLITWDYLTALLSRIPLPAFARIRIYLEHLHEDSYHIERLRDRDDEGRLFDGERDYAAYMNRKFGINIRRGGISGMEDGKYTFTPFFFLPAFCARIESLRNSCHRPEIRASLLTLMLAKRPSVPLSDVDHFSHRIFL